VPGVASGRAAARVGVCRRIARKGREAPLSLSPTARVSSIVHGANARARVRGALCPDYCEDAARPLGECRGSR